MRKSVKAALCAFALLALLALDAAITFHIASRDVKRAASAAATLPLEARDPLDQFRLERQQLRARQQGQLNDIIYNDASDEDTVARAQSMLLDMIERSEQECALEGLLQGRGFEDALVSIGQRSANVLLRSEAVTQQEAAVILDLVLRQTGLTGGNVKIIPVK